MIIDRGISMGGSKIINTYFKEAERKLQYKRTDGITGFKYNSIDGESEGEILRFFIDKNLDACISNIKHDKLKSSLYEYEEASDLLLIGFCLEGQIQINYRQIKTISKGQVLYFRPREDFYIKSLDHNFLYYIIDLNNFKQAVCQEGCNRNKPSFYESYVDCVCKKGQLHIKEAPYMMKSSIDEIKAIKNIDGNNFLDYANVKGRLFNYLTCLLKLRIDGNPALKRQGCKLHKCKKKRVSEAKKIIIDNLDKHITIKEIADRMGLSTYKLQNSFKKIEGTTVYNFILKVKIDNSKVLLRNTDDPIIEISQKLGYENSSKFSTAFKRITGHTPSEYRQANRN